MRIVLPVLTLLLFGCAGFATVGKVTNTPTGGDHVADTDRTRDHVDTAPTAADTGADDTADDTDAASARTDPPVDTGAPPDPGPVVVPDRDGDGYCGDDVTCPPGLLSGDCDDDDPGVNPGAVEIAGDGVDNDCDGHGGPDDDTGYGR